VPTLRSIIDGTTIFAAAPKAKNPSPIAKHIADHMQDPLGATKEVFQDLQEKKLAYDNARENAQRSLAPVKSTLDHVSQMHGIQPGMATPGLDQGPMGMGQNPDDPDQLDENGNPLNMSQQPGGPNGMQRPSQQGFAPGVAPGPQEGVRPAKMGQAAPGGKPASNAGAGPTNKMAAKPKGNKSLPGAKGPGDKKVANKTNKAQDSSSRQIKVNVTASEVRNGILAGSSSRLETQLGFSTLKFGGVHSSVNSVIPKGGDRNLQSNGPMGGPGMSNAPGPQGGPGMTGKPLQAGPAQLSDKATDPGDEVAMNPVIRSKGHSKGAKKGWSIRNKGHVSGKEKQAHYSTMDSSDINARDFSQKQRKKLAKSGEAMPGGGYPIANKQDLANAKQAIGRAKNRSATIRHINERAKALGAPGFGK
jgi:hypothetical protein